MKGLSFFRRTNVRHNWLIAAYHSPHSLTWRWCIGFGLSREEARRWWPIWMPYRTNNGWQLVIRFPWIGMLRFSQQQPMYYRNLYQTARDEITRKDDALHRLHDVTKAVAEKSNHALH